MRRQDRKVTDIDEQGRVNLTAILSNENEI